MVSPSEFISPAWQLFLRYHRRFSVNRMDFLEQRYYRWTKIYLLAIGQWPYQSSKWLRVHQSIVKFAIISVITVQMIKLFEIWGDVDTMIDIFTPSGVQAAAIAKSCTCMFNNKKMRTMLGYMQRDWSSLTSEIELEILAKFAEDGRVLLKSYASVFPMKILFIQIYHILAVGVLQKIICTHIGFLFGSLIIYLLIPLMPSILDVIVPLNETREPHYLYQAEHFVDRQKNYYYIALHTSIGTTLTIMTVVATDGLFFTFVHHVCGMIAIVGYRLEKTSKELNLVKLDVNAKINEDEFYAELVGCIRKHQNAIKFAVLIESSYTKLFLFLLGICMTLISISLLQLLVKLGQYDELYRIMQFIVAQLFHLFYNSWAGQKLINESTKLRESIYNGGWYGFSFRSRKLVKMTLMGATNPLKITACNLYVMSMENFGMILQTSISYFTVLASLR